MLFLGRLPGHKIAKTKKDAYCVLHNRSDHLMYLKYTSCTSQLCAAASPDGICPAKDRFVSCIETGRFWVFANQHPHDHDHEDITKTSTDEAKHGIRPEVKELIEHGLAVLTPYFFERWVNYNHAL